MGREDMAAMMIVEVPQGSTGTVVVLTFKHGGSALNLSTASGRRYCAKTVGGAAVATDVAAAWTTNGTDGKVSVTMTAALVTIVRDLLVHCEIVGFNGGNVISRNFILRVVPNARGI